MEVIYGKIDKNGKTQLDLTYQKNIYQQYKQQLICFDGQITNNRKM